MTRCIVAGGVEVLGFDMDEAAAGRFGAKRASSARQIMQETDIIFLSLPDSTVIEKVVEGEGGLLDHVRPGQIVADMSTASAASTRRIAAKFAEKGAFYVDAGISGGAAAAEKGALTLMVGGDPDAIGRLEPVFSLIAKKVIVMGECGAGHTAKLLNNFLNAVSLAATAEVMVAGKKAGLDLHRRLGGLDASSGVN
ncbi:MAG: NAD(P)-dependent oxidoreductase, partial [Martelella sp.]